MLLDCTLETWGGGGGVAMLGYPGCAVFHGILFAPKFQSRISILKKNCKVGLYFAGKSSNFVVIGMI